MPVAIGDESSGEIGDAEALEFAGLAEKDVGRF